MHVANASISDAPQLVALINSAYRSPRSATGWTDESELIEGQRIDRSAVAAEFNAGRFVVLRGEPEGPILACLHVTAQDVDTWYLSLLAVDPARQGDGLGGLMLRELESQAERAGIARIRITVIQQRTSLIEWYERRGFRRTGATMPFPYDDASVGRPLRDDLLLIVLEVAIPRD
jgi:ribosomal protein S18 acetylase RimI-like enzyme